MVRVNGAEMDIVGKSVAGYLSEAGYNLGRVAVERNGDIVFRADYDRVILQAGDSLEIVSFVGGG